MTIATKNGAIIVKDGKLAENCGCCQSDPCFKKYSSINVSVTTQDFFRRTTFNPLHGPPRYSHDHVFFPGSQYVGEFELSLERDQISSMPFGAGTLITTDNQWVYYYPTSSLICPASNSQEQVFGRPAIRIGKTFSQLHVFGVPVQNVAALMFFRADFIVLRDCGLTQKSASSINCTGGSGNEINQLPQSVQFYIDCQNTSTLGFQTPIAFDVPTADNFSEQKCQVLSGAFSSQEQSGSRSYSLNVLEWIA